MAAGGDIWDADAWPRGWHVRHVAQTGSTNSDLIATLESGDAGDRCVLVADHQTAGRGRLDRRWDAPSGSNLLVSIAIVPTPSIPAAATHRVALAALAAVGSIRPERNAALKWPNDLLLDGAKLAGILAQRSARADGVVVGLGLNVGWAPEGASRIGDDVTTAEVLRLLLLEYDRLPDDLLPAYRDRLATLGQRVRIESPAGRFTVGTAVDLDADGRLIVDVDDGPTVAYDVGDVVHLRAAGG